MKTPRSPGSPRSRSAFVVGLLLLTLGLAGVLAYQAQDAARSHRAVAEKALREYAAVAAWEYTGVLRRDMHAKAIDPGLEVVARLGGKEPGVPLGPLGRLDALAEEFGWPYEGRVLGVFRLTLGAGTLDWVGGEAPPAAAALWIADSLAAHAAAAYDADWEQAARLVGPPDARRLVGYRLYPPGGNPALAYGFVSDLGTLDYLAPMIFDLAPLLPPALTRGHATGELLSVTLRDAEGRELYASEPLWDSPFEAHDTVGAAFGGLSASIALRPEAAGSLLIGGLPGSRLPVVLGLLVLAAGLVVAAIFQLRREYELTRLRADFVSGVSHELRTPLAQIRMFGETLLLGRVRDEEERRRSLEILVKEARRLTHQVDNVLLFSRAERDGVRLSPEPLDLSALVREVAESFAPVAEAAGARLETSCEDAVGARVDAVSLPQALLNLLDNAVKYGPRGQAVRLALAWDPAGVARISVEDGGRGVPSDDRERVWEPYFRLDRDRDSSVAGSGIGLAVVREVVRAHGGEARVESSSAGGARFVIEVPAWRETPAASAGAEGRRPAGSRA